MKKVSKEHILFLHQMLIKHTGGADGIGDEELVALGLGLGFYGPKPISKNKKIIDKEESLCYTKCQ